MGNIEKLISLGVLCLIVVILAVTFTPTDLGDRAGRGGSVRAQDGAGMDAVGQLELAEANRQDSGRSLDLESETGTGLVHTDSNRPRPSDLRVNPEFPANSSETNTAMQDSKSSPLLSTDVRLKPTRVSIPAGSILVSANGLEDSDLEDFKLYRARANETYASLADRFYGDASSEWILRRYNEDRPTVVPGKYMFVPVFASEEELVAEAAATEALPQDRYLVQDGDSLWTIAKEAYGDGSQWPRIHEANLEVIPKPHDLKPGLRLRIPH